MFKALEFLNCLDFITPFYNLFITLTRHTRPFFVPFDCEWSGAAIHDLLEQFGIEMLTWDICNGEQFFNVPEEQMDWACQVLVSNGVPLLHERWSE